MAEDGEDDLKNATWDRQDAVLEASWRALGRDLGGLGAFLGSKPRRGGAAPQISKPPWKDEVFEEEESAEVLGDPARHCHPDYVRGRRIQSLRAFRRAALRVERSC